MLTSFACEPLLTSLGAGGYMLVVDARRGEPVLLDFFVEAPGRGADVGARGRSWSRCSVSFGDAIQVFNIGAGVGRDLRHAGRRVRGVARGSAGSRWRAGRAGGQARPRGRRAQRPQAYVVEILAGIVTSTPECAALFAPDGRRAAVPARSLRQPELADALERLGAEGAGAVLHGRHRGGDRRLAGRARAGSSPREDLASLRGRRPRADPGRATAGARC